MADLKQSATNTATFNLDIDTSVYTALEFGLFQNGEKVLSYTQSDVALSGGVATLVIPASDAASLSPARLTVEVRAAKADGTSVLLSDGVVATIERSNY
jgi:hypothetical protein